MTGWIIGGAAALLLIAFCLSNIRVEGSYQNGKISAQARWLFIRYTIWPRPEKTPEKARKRGKTDPKPPAAEKDLPTETTPPARGARRQKDRQMSSGEAERKGAEQSKTLKDTLEMILHILHSAVGPAKYLYRHLWLRNPDLSLIVARADAAETAIAYGQMNGWVHGAYAALSQLIRIKNGQVRVQADYLSQTDRLTASGQLTVRVGVVLVAGIWFGISFLKRLGKELFGDSRKVRQRKEKRA